MPGRFGTALSFNGVDQYLYLMPYDGAYDSLSWTHLTATYDYASTTLRLFVNGEQVGVAGNVVYSPIRVSAGVGVAPCGALWRGLIDEVRILSRAETPEQVALDYRRGSAVLYTADRSCQGRRTESLDEDS